MSNSMEDLPEPGGDHRLLESQKQYRDNLSTVLPESKKKEFQDIYSSVSVNDLGGDSQKACRVCTTLGCGTPMAVGTLKRVSQTQDQKCPVCGKINSTIRLIPTLANTLLKEDHPVKRGYTKKDYAHITPVRVMNRKGKDIWKDPITGAHRIDHGINGKDENEWLMTCVGETTTMVGDEKHYKKKLKTVDEDDNGPLVSDHQSYSKSHAHRHLEHVLKTHEKFHSAVHDRIGMATEIKERANGYTLPEELFGEKLVAILNSRDNDVLDDVEGISLDCPSDSPLVKWTESSPWSQPIQWVQETMMIGNVPQTTRSSVPGAAKRSKIVQYISERCDEFAMAPKNGGLSEKWQNAMAVNAWMTTPEFREIGKNYYIYPHNGKWDCANKDF